MASNNWNPDQLAKVLARGHHTSSAVLVPESSLVTTNASKLGNHPTEYNGVRYDSKTEACYARDLDFKVKAGLVRQWERQVRFPLHVDGVLITTYVLDFRVSYADGHTEHIDVKGQRSGNPYQLFKIKKRLMLVVLGIDVLERK